MTAVLVALLHHWYLTLPFWGLVFGVLTAVYNTAEEVVDTIRESRRTNREIDARLEQSLMLLPGGRHERVGPREPSVVRLPAGVHGTRIGRRNREYQPRHLAAS